MSADDIVSLLSYMYQGEVFIEESKLTSFLHTAALLQVKGLTGVTQQVRIRLFIIYDCILPISVADLKIVYYRTRMYLHQMLPTNCTHN